MKYFFFILLTVICFACNLKQKTDNASTTRAANDSVPQLMFADEKPLEELDLSDIDINVNADSLVKYLSKARAMRQDLMMKLKDSTPEQADSIYWLGEFWFTETPESESLVVLVTPIVDRWGLNGGEAAKLADIKVLDLLKKEGIEPEYQGEGYAEIRLNAYFYYDIFKPYLPESSREFLKLLADNDNIIDMDAGLVVPLDSLVARCVRWEEFLKKYPDIEQRNMIISQYGHYMGLVMFCTYDNTPAFDHTTRVVDKYVFDEINNSIKNYPANTTTDILEQYVAELKKSDYKHSKELEDKIMSMGILRKFDRTDIYY